MIELQHVAPGLGKLQCLFRRIGFDRNLLFRLFRCGAIQCRRHIVDKHSVLIKDQHRVRQSGAMNHRAPGDGACQRNLFCPREMLSRHGDFRFGVALLSFQKHRTGTARDAARVFHHGLRCLVNAVKLSRRPRHLENDFACVINPGVIPLKFDRRARHPEHPRRPINAEDKACLLRKTRHPPRCCFDPQSMHRHVQKRTVLPPHAFQRQIRYCKHRRPHISVIQNRNDRSMPRRPSKHKRPPQKACFHTLCGGLKRYEASANQAMLIKRRAGS